MIQINSIFHPTDFSQGDYSAFAHALKLTQAFEATLDLLHVAEPRESVDWNDFPSVRDVAVRWQLVPPGASREQVAEAKLKVRKVRRTHHDPVGAIIDYVQQHAPDLLVLATHQRHAISRWTHHSIAEPIARRSRTRTLFVPRDATGFVSELDGAVELRHIVVPISKSPRPALALEAATRLASTLNCKTVQFTLFYGGPPDAMPLLQTPAHPGWTFEKTAWEGDVVDHVLSISREQQANLIVMATQGHDSLLDAIRGSTTERVLHGATCPLLAVPSLE